jgi:hypothetical protein
MDNKQGLNRWRHQASWLVLGGVVATAVLFLFLAPEERTLGSGIRSVYVHVSLIWTGLAGLIVAGLLGLLLLFTGRPRVAAWMNTVGWVGAGFYAAGVAASAVASRANWGNIFWQEPRMAAAFNGLALVVVVLAANVWIPWPRLRGALQAALPVGIFWFTTNAPLVLHPKNPILTSDSLGIKLAFGGLFLLTAVVAAWIVWRVVMKSGSRVVE